MHGQGLQFTTYFALAVVAAVAYVLGRIGRRQPEIAARSADEVRQAGAVARELESIADEVRRHLAAHHASISRFKQRVTEIGDQPPDTARDELYRQADEILQPTLQLATQLAGAYDEIRQHSNHLAELSEVADSPLASLGGAQSLTEALRTSLAMLARYELPFALAMFEIDPAANDAPSPTDRRLHVLARVICGTVRETDVVFYVDGEFVVVMPHTTLERACVGAERVRSAVESSLGLSVSGGLSQALDGDNGQTLLSRARAALYSAKAAGRNCVYRHTGREIEFILDDEAVSVGHDAENF